MPKDFRLLDLAEQIVDEVNDLLRTSRPRLLYHDQIEEAAGSISSNIREGYGRREGPERNQFLRYSRGSAGEVDDRLNRYRVARRLAAKRFWRLRDRLDVFRKMLNSIIGE